MAEKKSAVRKRAGKASTKALMPDGGAAASSPVLVTAPVMPVILERLEAEFPVIRLWEEKDPDAVIARQGGSIRAAVAGFSKTAIDATFMDRFPALEIISSVGVGYDHIDAAAAAKRGIIVTNTPDVLTDEVADVALGLTIATVRRLPQADSYLRGGHWVAKGAFPLTDSLRGKTMGIVGLGRIGKAIAKRARAFGLKIAYHGRSRQDDVKYPYYADLVEMAEAVDILMVVTPGGSGTRHLINRRVIESLGPTGTLINVARGSVVDEQALVKALSSGKLGAAGLDVFDVEPCLPKELSAMEHVVLLPHVASASVHTRTAMANLTADNIVNWLRGLGPVTPVVETPWQPASGRAGKDASGKQKAARKKDAKTGKLSGKKAKGKAARAA